MWEAEAPRAGDRKRPVTRPSNRPHHYQACFKIFLPSPQRGQGQLLRIISLASAMGSAAAGLGVLVDICSWKVLCLFASV